MRGYLVNRNDNIEGFSSQLVKPSLVFLHATEPYVFCHLHLFETKRDWGRCMQGRGTQRWDCSICLEADEVME